MRLGFTFLVNSQNDRAWSTYNPQNVQMHEIKLGIWVTKSRRRIICPVFFNESINVQEFQRLLLERFINLVNYVEPTNCYFQQDSTTAYTAPINYLKELFPG
jgi:hypothetical protein